MLGSLEFMMQILSQFLAINIKGMRVIFIITEQVPLNIISSSTLWCCVVLYGYVKIRIGINGLVWVDMTVYG